MRIAERFFRFLFRTFFKEIVSYLATMPPNIPPKNICKTLFFSLLRIKIKNMLPNKGNNKTPQKHKTL